jgi:Na+-driven multidrug efflux pump
MLIQPLSTICGALVHLALIGVFVYALDWGYSGVCWATAMVFVTKSVVTQIYIYYQKDF